MEYTLYCDESVDTGNFYGDFFGGCIVEAHDLQLIISSLTQYKLNNHINAEMKWTKVTEAYLDKYIGFIHLFFSFVASRKVKVRIMFRKMNNQYSSPSGADKYFKLYYQFIKHAFGLTRTQNISPFSLRIYLDQLPQKRESVLRFKKFLADMPNIYDCEGCAFSISPEQIGEIKSHEHVLLQCVDIVMGAMQFKLNKLHKKKQKGKRTVAKEMLYKAIYREICSIHPHFNISISTGNRGYENPHWESPYEHWLFTPHEKESYTDIWMKYFAEKAKDNQLQGSAHHE